MGRGHRIGGVAGVVGTLAVTAGLGLGTARPAPAQDAPPPVAAPPAGGEPAPAAPAARPFDGVLVMDVLRSFAAATGTPVLWNDGDKALQRRIGGTRLPWGTGAPTLDAVQDLLIAHDVVLVPIGAGTAAYFAADVRILGQVALRLAVTPFVADDAAITRIEGRTGLYVAAVIRAPGANLRELRAGVMRLSSPNNLGSVVELPEASALFVCDFAPNVVAIYRLLQLAAAAPVALPADGPHLDAYDFGSTAARDLADRALRALLSGDPAPAPTPGAPAAVRTAAVDLPAAAGTSTPRLLVRGSATQLEVVRTAMASLGGTLVPAASTPR